MPYVRIIIIIKCIYSVHACGSSDGINNFDKHCDHITRQSVWSSVWRVRDEQLCRQHQHPWRLQTRQLCIWTVSRHRRCMDNHRKVLYDGRRPVSMPRSRTRDAEHGPCAVTNRFVFWFVNILFITNVVLLHSCSPLICYLCKYLSFIQKSSLNPFISCSWPTTHNPEVSASEYGLSAQKLWRYINLRTYLLTYWVITSVHSRFRRQVSVTWPALALFLRLA